MTRYMSRLFSRFAPTVKEQPPDVSVVHMYIRVIDELLLEIADLREQLKTPFDE